MNLNFVRALHNCRPKIPHNLCVNLNGNIEVSVKTSYGEMLVIFYFDKYENDIDMVVKLFDPAGLYFQISIFYSAQTDSEFERSWKKLIKTPHFQEYGQFIKDVMAHVLRINIPRLAI